ncbi:MAG: hypothetical protein WA633_07835 [Stellaceae bacterium]
MSGKSQLHDPFAYGRRAGTFSAWAMAIMFATVAMISFAIDQTVSLSTGSAQNESPPPSLLHPIQLIESLIDAASD